MVPGSFFVVLVVVVFCVSSFPQRQKYIFEHQMLFFD